MVRKACRASTSTRLVLLPLHHSRHTHVSWCVVRTAYFTAHTTGMKRSICTCFYLEFVTCTFIEFSVDEMLSQPCVFHTMASVLLSSLNLALPSPPALTPLLPTGRAMCRSLPQYCMHAPRLPGCFRLPPPVHHCCCSSPSKRAAALADSWKR